MMDVPRAFRPRGGPEIAHLSACVLAPAHCKVLRWGRQQSWYKRGCHKVWSRVIYREISATASPSDFSDGVRQTSPDGDGRGSTGWEGASIGMQWRDSAWDSLLQDNDPWLSRPQFEASWQHVPFCMYAVHSICSFQTT
jgi:hypothetical protein